MNVRLGDIVSTVRNRWLCLLATTFLFTAASLGYALLKQDKFDARLPLIVRDEGYGSLSRLGDFTSVDAMQTAQETILEVAKHPTVLREALLDVGRPSGDVRGKEEWPSAKFVDEFAGDVSVSAPGGAQFGRTEMIYLTVKAKSPQRAVKLADAICAHLIDRMKGLRREKYNSILQELTATANLARGELATTTAELQAFESAMGANLAELRMSMDTASGQSHLRSSLTQIDADLRDAKTNLVRARNEIAQLQKATRNPAALITLPNKALDAQPTLRKLRESFVEAQVATARLTGELSPSHPKLQSAMAAEEKIKRQLISELRRAIQSREVELTNVEQRIASLEQQREAADRDLANLSTQRTEYANLLAALDQRTSFLKQAEADLATARASMLSSAKISLIQKVDAPIPGVKPLGPGRTVIVVVGCLAGIATGLGLIYIAGIEVAHKRRASDRIQYGRREGDAVQTADGRFVNRRGAQRGRRQSDQVPSSPSARKSPSESPAPRRPVTAMPLPELDVPDLEPSHPPRASAKH